MLMVVWKSGPPQKRCISGLIGVSWETYTFFQAGGF